MGNALPCCTDNDNSQTNKLNKKNASPQKQKNKVTKSTPTVAENKSVHLLVLRMISLKS